MRLLRVYTQGDSYVIDALKSIKLWKYRLGSKKVKFQSQGDLNCWKYSDTDKKVSTGEERTLRRWIRDHRRFVK